mmetsp:Transcript_88048/g.257378  ORF Transcript_88048/g.257378 Transcript_88048/m.257378 type:complete len:714 (+) Transcript_88048:160-2301(+)
MARVQKQQPADLTLNKYSLEYAFEELERATHSFDSSCKLGNGGFGAVYRGTQSDGTDVAIKVLELPDEAGFEDEVRVLSKFRHPNLVILMGFARCDSQRLLVYELLEGGDVYKRLEKSNSEGVPFSWRQRVSAAFDAACGLSHLHNSSPKVFHRDIKSPNILLDRNGTAKMADFGLACLSHAKKHKVENAAGTVGYACPLYARRCVVTEGSEVYSFGVVLLELLTASPPAWIVRSPDGARKYEFLAGHVGGDADIAVSLSDPGADWPEHVAYAVAELVLRCIHFDDEQRPCFTDVVKFLRKLRDAPDSPAPQHTPDHSPHVRAHPPAAGQAQHQQAAPVQQVAMMPVGQPSIEMPRLWSLECEYIDGIDTLATIPSEHHALVHRQAPGAPLLTLFKVGRLLQEEFFQAIFVDESIRNTVSREHFQIWAMPANDDPLPDGLNPGCVPCSFFLSNLSRSWTMVNGTLLDACGKYAQLHSGDRITLGRKVVTPEGVRYSPLIQFRFNLAGSVLHDAHAQEVDLPEDKVDIVSAAVVPASVPPALTDMRRGTSLAGNVVPRFLLEVGGRGVLAEVESARRLIAHGPQAGIGLEKWGSFGPLILGRGHAASFWQRLLTQEALSAMASEHVAFEAAHAGGQGGDIHQVTVRNCSTAHPVLVCKGSEQGSIECAHALKPGDQRVLQHGDLVIVVPLQSLSVWFTFWDLMALKLCSAAGGA